MQLKINKIYKSIRRTWLCLFAQTAVLKLQRGINSVRSAVLQTTGRATSEKVFMMGAYINVLIVGKHLPHFLLSALRADMKYREKQLPILFNPFTVT